MLTWVSTTNYNKHMQISTQLWVHKWHIVAYKYAESERGGWRKWNEVDMEGHCLWGCAFFSCLQRSQTVVPFIVIFILFRPLLSRLSLGNTLGWLATQYRAKHMLFQHNAFDFAGTMLQQWIWLQLPLWRKRKKKIRGWFVRDDLPWGRKSNFSNASPNKMSIVCTPPDPTVPTSAFISICVTSLHSGHSLMPQLQILYVPFARNPRLKC